MLLMFNIDKNSVDENTLQLSFDRDRKNQEFLYEFGLSNTRFNGYLISMNTDLENSKFDKNIKKLYDNNIFFAFKNFVDIEIYGKRKSTFGNSIFVRPDFIKKYGSKIVYIYEIKNGDIRIKDKGTILDICRKYKITLMDIETIEPLIGLSDKSEKDIKIAFSMSKDLISNELKKYNDYINHIEWKPFKISGTYSLICEIDVEEYYKSFNKGFSDDELDKLYYAMIHDLKKIEKKINGSNSLKNGFHIQLDKINNDDYVLGFFLLYDKDTKYYPS